MSIEMHYNDGRLDKINVHDVSGTDVIDCRNRPSGMDFVAISIQAADEQRVELFCPPDVTRMLHHQLDRLFVGDAVRTRFRELFGEDLTIDALNALAEKLHQAVPVDFPAEVDPVAAIDRSG